MVSSSRRMSSRHMEISVNDFQLDEFLEFVVGLENYEQVVAMILALDPHDLYQLNMLIAGKLLYLDESMNFTRILLLHTLTDAVLTAYN